MDTENDLKNLTFNPEDVADCYCKVYSQEPWNQNFDKSEITKQIAELKQNSNAQIETATQDDQVIAFYIAQRDTLENILPIFKETLPQILSTPINNKMVDNKYLCAPYIDSLTQKINNSIPEKNNVLYIMDLGILPEYRVFKIQKWMYDVMNQSVGHDGYVIAQTLSFGPMADLIKKVKDIVIIDQIPINDAQYNHIIFTFNAKNYPRK